MIITNERLEAAARTYRFGGWTARGYSILEHMTIGAKLLKDEGRPIEVWGAFLLHDIEETEFVGDVPNPHKGKYMNEVYFTDVGEFNVRLTIEVGLPQHCFANKWVKAMDDLIWRVEALVLNARLIREDRPTCPISEQTHHLTTMIAGGSYSGHSTVPEWKSLFAELIA